jgi:hypothetical protein
MVFFVLGVGCGLLLALLAVGLRAAWRIIEDDIEADAGYQFDPRYPTRIPGDHP